MSLLSARNVFAVLASLLAASAWPSRIFVQMEKHTDTHKATSNRYRLMKQGDGQVMDPDTGRLVPEPPLPITLVGYGDYGMLAEGDAFNEDKFFERLDKLKFGPNDVPMVRVWLQYQFADGLMPFQKIDVKEEVKDAKGRIVRDKSGRPVLKDTKKNQYSLWNATTKAPDWDENFFTRLSRFVESADQRGVVVQLCLFDANQLEEYGPGHPDGDKIRWNCSPYNRKNQATTAPKAYGLTTPGVFFDTNQALWKDVNKAYVERVVQTVGNRGNVIYEIMNEPSESEVRGRVENASIGKGVEAFHEVVVEALQGEFARTSPVTNAPYTGSQVISANVSSKSVLLKWLGQDTYGPDSVGMVSIHLPASWNGLKDNKGPRDMSDLYGVALSTINLGRPTIISNDGQDSQAANKGRSPSDYEPNRLERTQYLVDKFVELAKDKDRYVYADPGATTATFHPGFIHLEFLDKRINGKTWPYVSPNDGTGDWPNYEPRAGKYDARTGTGGYDDAVLKILGGVLNLGG